MIKGLEKVSVTIATGRELEMRAEKVLDVLMESTEGLRAKEIACRCGYMDLFDKTQGDHYKVAKPLKWLVQIGLVERYQIDGEPIEIDVEKFVYNEDEIVVVDGVEYIRKRPRGPRRGHWEWTKKTIVPKVTYFKIVA